MIEWSFFYKALGINESIMKPTYYELLDIDPDLCNETLIDEKLKEQKIKLRQNIPNQQFIPLILTFDKTKLEHAASVLRDPQTREKYNLHLKKKEHQKKHQERKEKAYRKLLAAINKILDDMLNSDRTIDESKRPELAMKLGKLQLNEKQINKILGRIPDSIQTTTSPRNDVIDYFTMSVDLFIDGPEMTSQAGQKIMVLAQKLNIPPAKVREILASKHINIRSNTIESNQYNKVEILTDVEDDYSNEKKKVWSVLKITIPIISIILFAFIVWFFHYRKRSNIPLSSPQQVTRIDPIRTEDINTSNTFTQAEPVNKQGNHLNSTDANSIPEFNQPSTPQVTPNEPNSSSEINEILVTPEQIREAFFIGGQSEGILTDTASLMLLSYSRLLQYTSGTAMPEDELRSVLEKTSIEKQKWFIEKVEVIPLFDTTTNNSQQEDNINYKECSIEELIERDNQEAVKELFRRLDDVYTKRKHISTDIKKAARALYGLERLSNQDIPKQLADRIPKSAPLFAYLIVKSLTKANGNGHRLAFFSTREEREICAGWWKRNVPDWGNLPIMTKRQLSLPSGLSPRTGRITGSQIANTLRSSRSRYRQRRSTGSPPSSTSANNSVKSLPPWLTVSDINKLALLAVIQNYSSAIAEILDNNQSKLFDIDRKKETLGSQPEFPCDPVSISNGILSTYEQIYKTLQTYLKENADENLSNEISIIERKRWAYYNTCKTSLQEVFVYSEASSELFYLLVCSELTDPNSVEYLKSAQNEHKNDLNTASDVLHQLRESSYYQFLLLHNLVINRCTMPFDTTQNSLRITR